jgi:predicted RNA binding protein YcfA (HicA-like mRNA interferase family)/predicted RNase H-like HicB family nuclease
MPRKVRQLIRILEKAGIHPQRRKGSHRNFTHPRVMRQSPSVVNWVMMRSITKRKKSGMQSDVQKIADRYEHIVYWSDEDRCYIGRCPELFLGGVHGDDVDAVFRELRQVAEENAILHQEQAPCRSHATLSTAKGLRLKIEEGSKDATLPPI